MTPCPQRTAPPTRRRMAHAATHLAHLALLALAASAAHSARAQEVGHVTSSTPLYQQVAVPQQHCQSTPVAVPNAPSGAGALMGAIAGAALGSQMGAGNGKTLATMAGMVGGAAYGERIENPGSTLQSQTVCTTRHAYENRLVGYAVTYDYAGKSYSVQWPTDPGPTIALHITPMAAAPAAPALPQHTQPQPQQVQPPFATPMPQSETRVVYVPTPVYRAYPPLQTHIQLGWGWGGHPYGHGHRHTYPRGPHGR